MLIGTFCRSSLRFCAVTMISSSRWPRFRCGRPGCAVTQLAQANSAEARGMPALAQRRSFLFGYESCVYPPV